MSFVAKSFACPQRPTRGVASTDTSTCVGPSTTQVDDTMRWARSLTETPAWLVAPAYALSPDRAEAVQAIVADLIRQDEAGQ